MNIVQIEEVVKTLVTKTESGDLNQSEFIYELLLAYGHRKQSVTRLRTGERNLARDEANTVFWKRHLYFKVETSAELHGVIDAMRKEARTARHKIRFVIATDFKLLLAIDTKTGDTLDIEFKDLAKKFDFFLPWAGMEKAVYQGENPADVKAAEKLAKLFDEIKADNFNATTVNDPAKLHELNVFLSRLLFCFFAEDTKIFADNQFSDAIASHTSDDGSDLADYLKRLFTVLNQAESERPGLPDYLSSFPYVNGGLFKDDIQIPSFSRKSRKILIECGAELDWSDINPDIFGSMFQAVVHTEKRSIMGQHYTSVPNIMNVIEPLFLNDLYEELDKQQDNQKKLLELQQRIGKIKLFDPACGSGNFLIIAYKELRKLEMEILKRLQELEFEKSGQMFKPFSVIQLSQFYGIEIDDFAHEVAILSLWLTEHQMNEAFKDEFGETLPSLPLKNGGNIIRGNALKCDWNIVCPNVSNEEVFVMGNPPYYGARKQTPKQKQELQSIFKKTLINPGSVDYISGWFYKAAEYIKNGQQFSFVSTSSICQGSHVGDFWPGMLRTGVEITFAIPSFRWTNNAKKQAGVYCVIIGLSKDGVSNKKVLRGDHWLSVSNINPYLTDSNLGVIKSRSSTLSDLPVMGIGNKPIDGGFYLFTEAEKEEFIGKEPLSKIYFRKWYGAQELKSGQPRYCLLVKDISADELDRMPLVKDRITKVRKFRLSSSSEPTIKLAEKPERFHVENFPKNNYIVIPKVSPSDNEYIPVAYFEQSVVSSDLLNVVDSDDLFYFGILSSKMHMVWTAAVSGRFGNGIRYSSKICYNTFPMPKVSEEKKASIRLLSLDVLSVREEYFDKSLGVLYGKDMPESLRTAHYNLDLAVDEIFKSTPFKDDGERLKVLFDKYKTLTT